MANSSKKGLFRLPEDVLTIDFFRGKLQGKARSRAISGKTSLRTAFGLFAGGENRFLGHFSIFKEKC
jgi:hypothetical protein